MLRDGRDCGFIAASFANTAESHLQTPASIGLHCELTKHTYTKKTHNQHTSAARGTMAKACQGLSSLLIITTLIALTSRKEYEKTAVEKLNAARRTVLKSTNCRRNETLIQSINGWRVA
jgi:hypothetical protein